MTRLKFRQPVCSGHNAVGRMEEPSSRDAGTENFGAKDGPDSFQFRPSLWGRGVRGAGH